MEEKQLNNCTHHCGRQARIGRTRQQWWKARPHLEDIGDGTISINAAHRHLMGSHVIRNPKSQDNIPHTSHDLLWPPDKPAVYLILLLSGNVNFISQY